MTQDSLNYAGLRPRIQAFALDYLIIAAYLLCLLGLVRALGISPSWVGSSGRGQLVGFLSVTLPVTLYFAITEASHKHASWGKQKLSLRVTDLAGLGVGWPRSMARTVLKFVPWELAHTAIWRLRFATGNATTWSIMLGLVWMLIFANLTSLLVSRKCQTLYDWLASTIVVRQKSAQVTS